MTFNNYDKNIGKFGFSYNAIRDLIFTVPIVNMCSEQKRKTNIILRCVTREHTIFLRY